jgi:hypothetical protein
MPKPFVIDINKKLYLFSPKAFRRINGQSVLYFYANIPFAIVHNVTDKYIPPSLDSDAFSSVQKSKFIQDATTVSDENNYNILMIVCIVVGVLALVLGIINFTYVLKIVKAMNLK